MGGGVPGNRLYRRAGSCLPYSYMTQHIFPFLLAGKRMGGKKLGLGRWG